ncbi:hypothetical protein TWF694_011182 [Orbilia ellipsospora]|uniref:Uncharacterized protein n=1 Tax=Orbilia ellipsospora TaxID=2528407 RepID=A0AAV9X9G0_9PEZI
MVLCHAHAQLDDSFDEEYDVANYNLAQVAELEAASRLNSHNLQQTPLQPQNYQGYQNYSYKQMAPNSSLTHAHPYNQQQHHHNNHSSDPMQIDNLIAPNTNYAPSTTSRKLKRSCDFECDSAAAHHGVDASGTKRIKQVAF